MDEGGTKIQRNKGQSGQMMNSPPPQMMGAPQQMSSPPPPQMDPQMQQQMMQQQAYQQQMMQQQPQGYQQMPPQQQHAMGAPRSILKKPSYNKSPFGQGMDSATIKNSILVVVIFILLNSKMVWKQIMQLPFMGSVEPSIVALIVNSIIAGMIFYLFNVFFIKS
jgi:hypothetical protein